MDIIYTFLGRDLLLICIFFSISCYGIFSMTTDIIRLIAKIITYVKTIGYRSIDNKYT